VSNEPVTAAVSLVVIAHDRDNREHIFPSALRLKREDSVVWHTNPHPGEHSEGATFTVTFGENSPFDLPALHGKVGGSTEAVAVRDDAELGSYSYSVDIQTSKGARHYDPEIIIEEAVPSEPVKRAAARTAGGGA
jgi:hypothetical protein